MGLLAEAAQGIGHLRALSMGNRAGAQGSPTSDASGPSSCGVRVGDAKRWALPQARHVHFPTPAVLLSGKPDKGSRSKSSKKSGSSASFAPGDASGAQKHSLALVSAKNCFCAHLRINLASAYKTKTA
eukprot:4202716-Amphidinium_carterae.1